MNRSRARIDAAALVVSALLHGAIGLWIALEPPVEAGASGRALDEEAAERVLPPERRVPLGDPAAPSAAAAWLGFDRPQPGRAPVSETEQAALTRDPSSAVRDDRRRPGTWGGGTAEAVEVVAAAAARAAAEAAPAAAAVAELGRRSLKAVGFPARLLREMARDIPASDVTEYGMSTINRPPGTGRDMQTPGPTEPVDRSTPSVKTQQDEGRARSVASGEAAATATAPDPSRGEAADREADPAAPTDVDNDQLGKPLISQGLRIITTRPSFSGLSRVWDDPRDPMLRVWFDRSGVPTRVEVVRSSGSTSIDQRLVDCLYEWRAEGAALRDAPRSGPEAAPVVLDLRILL